ncbi:MAG TPA: hypothetical protein VJR30_20620, partial [Bradyrhizobium sp.]|nr:hypothetical protein [Bradyrhizobium sp.]
IVILISRINVNPLPQKYFPCMLRQIRTKTGHLIPEEGRRPSPPNVGMRCGGRVWRGDRSPGETPNAYGEVAWFWRRNAGVKPCVKSREVTVTQLLTGEIAI